MLRLTEKMVVVVKAEFEIRRVFVVERWTGCCKGKSYHSFAIQGYSIKCKPGAIITSIEDKSDEEAKKSIEGKKRFLLESAFEFPSPSVHQLLTKRKKKLFCVFLPSLMSLPRLPSIRELIKLYGLSAKSQLSQNFILDKNITGRNDLSW